jgi:hypothetical protein
MKNKKGKRTNTIVSQEDLSKEFENDLQIDESGLLPPVITRPLFRERLITSLLKWAKKPTSLDLMQFCIATGIQRFNLYGWMKEYPEILKAVEEARLIIGCNRRIGVIRKKLDGTYAYKDMYRLDPEFLEINKYNADMSKAASPSGNTFNINTDKPLVKTKEELKQEIDNI